MYKAREDVARKSRLMSREYFQILVVVILKDIVSDYNDDMFLRVGVSLFFHLTRYVLSPCNVRFIAAYKAVNE